MAAAKAQIDPTRLAALLKAEDELFARNNPKSKALFEEAKKSLHNGVPMNWMIRWCSPYPLFVESAKGAHFRDVDGHDYVDLCLGDTGAMTGHSPAVTVKAITQQLQKGITLMLPTENSIWVGNELKNRFGLDYWQIAMTATDANRFCLRLARQITKRKYVISFNWAYHGSVDETFTTLDPVTGKQVPRPGNIGPPVDPSLTTKCVEWNDVAALEAALKDGDVAVVLAEPVMTNMGIIPPIPGYHKAMRDLTRKYGTLLIIDETHTICTGPGGYTREFGLEPDMITIGKPIAGGFPAAAYGFTKSVSDRINAACDKDTADVGGIGGTLSANAVALTAIRATLEHVLTPASYKKTIPLATRFSQDVQQIIDKYNLPWSVVQLGCRAEYWFCPRPARNGTEAVAAASGDLDRFMHLFSLNRGILMTPFHAMALFCPDATNADVEKHTRVFHEAVQALLGVKPSATKKSAKL